jgi:hypothetical protein
VDIGHHRQKWKSPILGVAQIVLRDVFLASIFLAYVEPKHFFAYARENSPVQPLPPAPLPTEFRRFCEMKYLLEKETHNKNEENTLKELTEIFLTVYRLPK